MGGGRVELKIFVSERSGQVDFVADAIDHAFQPLIHIDIPEPQNLEAMRDEKCRTSFVLFNRIRMLTAIKLNHEFRIMAREISYEPPDRNLSAEMAAFRFQQTQFLPKLALFRRSILSKLASQQVRH